MRNFARCMAAVALATCAQAANRVEIKVDVPAGLEAYSGVQPVTFGVPFERGALRSGEGMQIVDNAGKRLPSQFEVTATWAPGSDEVRWLLVDALVAVDKGKPPKVFLEFGRDVPVTRYRLEGPDAAALRFNAGQFVLTDGDGVVYAPADVAATVERVGPARNVVKVTGKYVPAQGKYVADFLTRYRIYGTRGFMRVYHTLTWQTDASVKIGGLKFLPHGAEGTNIAAGLDGKAAPLPAGARLTQKDWNTVEGAAAGTQLDGWAQATEGGRTTFVGLRWPWQQHPTALSNENGRLAVHLIGPETPMSLGAEDVAVPPVKANVPVWNLRIFKDGLPGSDVIYNGPPALPHLTPRGVSKTWELLVWTGDAEVAPEVKNTLAQHPVLAHADPAFAVRAELPSPASPYDPKAFPDIESALQRAFAFYTRELAEEGDFGVWNYGDLQWTWTYRGYPIYRYWMNLGKGWSILPWALWIRSGDRRYWENGEANSRHCMDVDTCHIPGWDRDPNDWRLRGGQYHYSALHWGYGPEVFTYYVDSEYLPYCWYMTGYERAKDCLDEHAEAVARFVDREAYMKFFRENIAERAGRHLYVMVKNLCVLYEATWDPRLKAFAEQCLELTLMAQKENGNFHHVKTNHYLDQPLLIAARVFGWDRLGNPIRRWHDCLGDPLRMGRDGGAFGPMSLWTAVELARHGGDPRYLTAAAALMQAQAACVADAQNEWNGLNAIPGHEAGPALRDWPIAMSALSSLKSADRPAGFAPMTAFHGLLPVSKEMSERGWASRHLALVLDVDDKAFTVSMSFRPQLYRARITAPDGSVALEKEEEIEWTRIAYDSCRIECAVPADGKKGVYAVEVWHRGREGGGPAIHMESTTGRLVHVARTERFQVVSAQGGGAFWFRPKGGEDVSLSFMNGLEVLGRELAMDEEGRIVASSRVTGTIPFQAGAKPQSIAPGIPVGEPCRFRPADTRLHAFVAPTRGKDYDTRTASGILPFLSGQKSEWFDPAQYPCPDLDALIRAAR